MVSGGCDRWTYPDELRDTESSIGANLCDGNYNQLGLAIAWISSPAAPETLQTSTNVAIAKIKSKKFFRAFPNCAKG